MNNLPTLMKTRLNVHGGAWNIPEAQHAAHLHGVASTVKKISPLLENGMNALEAVEATVNFLEADPTFDAGRGAFLNNQGKIKLDAMIMDGKDLSYGAVAAVENLLHPVSLAKKVMEMTEHCLLVGSGAQAFARRINFPELLPEELLTERELQFFPTNQGRSKFQTTSSF